MWLTWNLRGVASWKKATPSSGVLVDILRVCGQDEVRDVVGFTVGRHNIKHRTFVHTKIVPVMSCSVTKPRRLSAEAQLHARD